MTPEEIALQRALQRVKTTATLGNNSTQPAGTYTNGNAVGNYGYAPMVGSTNDTQPTAVPTGLAFSASKQDRGLFSPMLANKYTTNSGNTYTGIGEDLYKSDKGTTLTSGALNGTVQWDPSTGSFLNTAPADSFSGGLASTLGSAWDGIGGAQGLSSIMGAVGTVGSFLNARDQNKEAKRMNDLKVGEYNRQVERDKDFSKNIAASGLGAYSAGVK